MHNVAAGTSQLDMIQSSHMPVEFCSTSNSTHPLLPSTLSCKVIPPMNLIKLSDRLRVVPRRSLGDNMFIAQDEIFGPVQSMLKFRLEILELSLHVSVSSMWVF
ncbi:hypothetical protein Pint_14506 [Pistacia integerrima]|uniref:Uncharacterized protein n=1 Tax=Pistacia integerrima TaxID=434235 RepID=A0ACC0Y9P1_9ROSI|nr:hypothetical protein Pint_14506 [Pistacia integerrima]